MEFANAIFGADAADIVKQRGREVARLWGINNISGAVFGVPAAFLVTYVVSQFTRQPSAAMQDFIDSIRVPRGAVRLADREAVVD